MVDSVVEKLLTLLEAETSSEMLEKLPSDTYKKAAVYVKSIKDEADRSGRDVFSRLAVKERELISSLVRRLLEVRVKKASKLVDGDLPYGNLTPEEKYVVEHIYATSRRMMRIERAVLTGQISILDSIAQKMASRHATVRFLKPAQPIIGSDLLRYGPFEKEDVAVLPIENVKLLVKQGVAVELWGIED